MDIVKLNIEQRLLGRAAWRNARQPGGNLSAILDTLKRFVPEISENYGSLPLGRGVLSVVTTWWANDVPFYRYSNVRPFRMRRGRA